MPNKMLVDASHPEETRVVVVRGNRIEEFDFESQDKKQLKGNIYLARVTRVEPSLQAAFVEYGGNRHGFLAFSEIHPDYYQIPVADRQALLRAEAEAHAEDDEDDEEREERGRGRRRRRGRKPSSQEAPKQAAGEDADAPQDAETDDGSDEGEAHPGDEADADGEAQPAIAESVSADIVSEAAPSSGNGANGNGASSDDEVESVGAEDALEEIRERRRPVRRQYKIQEVVKRRQILLVQVVKEERGNKGAALTTYLSLAGRYSVLMPNTARGGGISRKITSLQDRKRLKEIVKDLDVPQGMGVILRTAGEARTKAEIKRDYEYLMRLWDNVRELTLNSTAPSLVYEEGSLIKRSIRDLYNKDIDEIQVAGDEGYREAKDFMRMLMPSHAKVVQPYRDNVPIFARSGIEGQLDKMLQPQVTLKSGGYIIINQTEALVAIDVNSGRSTREHSIEDTALQTNLEAAEEVARQLRLRDLAGLIVIDFIDMEENRNNRAVEKRLKDHLKNDRARIQVGRISHFGLLEMSRQRIRASVLESTMQPCPHCGGAGHVRSDSSVALLVMRAIEEFLLKDTRHHITVRTPTATAIYVLNHKRANLTEMEARFGLTISIEADETVRAQHYSILKGAPVENPVVLPAPPPPPVEEEDDIPFIDEAEEEVAAEAPARPADGDEQPRKRRRRRRRRGDRDQASPEAGREDRSDTRSSDADADADEDEGDDAETGDAAVAADSGDDQPRKKRRRGKRGGRRNRRENEGTASDTDEAFAADAAEQPADSVAVAPTETTDDAAMAAIEMGSEDAPAAEAVGSTEAEAADGESAPAKKKPARRSRKKAEAEPEVAEAAADLGDAPAEAPEKPKRRRTSKKAAAEQAAAEADAAGQAAEAPAEEPAPQEVEQPREPRAAAAAAPPVEVVSSTPEGEAEEEPRPRKGGWWQRKSFF
jgi:ribonuclease E